MRPQGRQAAILKKFEISTLVTRVRKITVRLIIKEILLPGYGSLPGKSEYGSEL
jgi:hypothetical protein